MSNLSIDLKSHPILWMLFTSALTMVLIQMCGEPLIQMLRFEREAILVGEYWRLLSGHIVHLSWMHLLLNLAGLALVYVLGGNLLSPAAWGLTGLISVLAIDAGLLFCNPEIRWYVGLSGLLHGWFAAGVIALWRERGWHVAAPLLVLLGAKLVWELWRGPVPGTMELIGGKVIEQVHLFGAIAGMMSAVFIEIGRRASRRCRVI